MAECYVCGAHAEHECVKCGKPVCSKHFSGGFCPNCKQSQLMIPDSAKPTTVSPKDLKK